MTNENWLYRATRQIRFAPDREMVRQELREHLLDRRDAFLARGLPEKEAEEATTAAMGDPDEIAEELGRLHSPWWGYLWRGSQVLVWTAALCTLVLCFGAGNYFGWLQHPTIPDPIEGYSADYSTKLKVPHFWAPEGDVPLGGYQFSVPAAWVIHSGYTAAPAGKVGSHTELVILLRASTWRIWEPLAADADLVRTRPAVDDRGFHYSGSLDPKGRYGLRTCSAYRGGPGITWFEIFLTIKGPDDIPAWVDIPVGDYTLRVDLEKEVLSR